jgi:polysaccharide pyruvyl transferase WcaK-like protein
MRERVRILFDKAEVISVRGKYTVRHLEDNGLDTSKISSLADPVMACDIALTKSPQFIGGNVRDMPPVEIQHASTTQVHRLFAECYDWLIDTYDLPLNLISFRHNLDSDNDVRGADRVTWLMKNKRRVTRAMPPNHLEAVRLIGGSKFYFGQRLHPTIFAAVNGIPFVGLEYQFDKMLDWAGTVGLDNVINTRDVTLQSFIEAHKRVEGNMVKLSIMLPPKVAEIKATAKKIVELA